MNNDSGKKAVSDTIVVRLLNGILRGCEFSLDEATLFVMTKERDLSTQQQSTVLPDNMIFIPASGSSGNFELIPPAADATSVLIRELTEAGNVERYIGWQQTEQVGDLIFAVRRQQESWHKAVLDYPVHDMPVMNASSPKNHYFWLAGLVSTFMAAAIAAGWYYVESPQKQLAEITDIIGGGAENYDVLPGRDKVRYVIVSDKNAMSWARQALIKIPPSSTVIVTNSREEEQKVAQWLKKSWPAVKFHRVNFSNPRQPELIMSQERSQLTIQQEAVLRKQLMQHIPWAKTITFSAVKDTLVTAAAEHALAKIAQDFSKDTTRDGTTYIIHGELDDVQLDALKRVVTEFYQSWGDNYVTFSIELQNNWLKDKSFKYGDHGYIKVKPYNWFFSQPL